MFRVDVSSFHIQVDQKFTVSISGGLRQRFFPPDGFPQRNQKLEEPSLARSRIRWFKFGLIGLITCSPAQDLSIFVTSLTTRLIRFSDLDRNDCSINAQFSVGPLTGSDPYRTRVPESACMTEHECFKQLVGAALHHEILTGLGGVTVEELNDVCRCLPLAQFGSCLLKVFLG
jgi:hypothetical protein